MTTVDSRNFILNGGYLQKGRERNLRPEDLGKKTLNLAPSRYVELVPRSTGRGSGCWAGR
jgi:hypothetical protein